MASLVCIKTPRKRSKYPISDEMAKLFCAYIDSHRTHESAPTLRYVPMERLLNCEDEAVFWRSFMSHRIPKHRRVKRKRFLEHLRTLKEESRYLYALKSRSMRIAGKWTVLDCTTRRVALELALFRLRWLALKHAFGGRIAKEQVSEMINTALSYSLSA